MSILNNYIFCNLVLRPSFGDDVFAPRKWRRGWREYLASSLGVVWIEFSGAGASNNGLQKQCLPR